MPAGRRPTPTSLKILRGNPGKRPLPAGEVKPELGAGGGPPAFLEGFALELWHEVTPKLERLRLLSELDRLALVALCETYAEWRTARDYVREHGSTYTYETENGERQAQRPEVTIASDAFKRLRSLLIEFGLTPASRSKVEAVEPSTPSAF